MPRLDDGPMPPEIAGALTALDATLAGEPVDPEYAGLAELALLLSVDPPRPRPEFTHTLDQRVARRFARPARAAGPRRRWLYTPGLAAAAALVVVVVAVGSTGSGGSNGTSNTSAGPSTTVAAATSSASSSAAASAPASGAAKDLSLSPAARRSAPSGSSGSGSAASSSAPSSSAASGSAGSVAAGVPGSPPTPSPGANRQIVQSAQLALAASPTRIDDVAQQVFDVIGAAKGIVSSSTVTATGHSDGYANFELSVPSANLQQTLSALSRLRGARVLSRTDASSDITGQVGGAGQRLAEARALRRSLLKQLAAATTTAQVDSLQLQLRDADASIASDLSALRGLQRQVQYSQIALTIQASSRPAPVASGGSFTLHRALHDAGRLLVVAAGVALIALAALVPVGLVAALAAWVGLAVRRRRRDHALDLI